MTQTNEHMKVSDWLSKNVSSHAIQNHDDLSHDFIDATGEIACWPVHTVADARRAIEARGLGGSCAGPDDDEVCYGYEVAEALAHKYGDRFVSDKLGRGSIFRDCLAAIREQESKAEKA